MRQKPKTEKSLAVLTKELDGVFSDFIRLRDADEHGTITCFVTGERVWWKDADAAHWMPRANHSTRWHEQNVHATTQDSNRFDLKHGAAYTLIMVLRYGQEVAESIRDLSRSLVKFTRPELQEKIDYYKEKVKELKKQKGL